MATAKKDSRLEIVYSTQTNGYIRGRKYSNPRFFNGQARSDVKKVIVLGDFPDVVRAYQAAGIPVVVGSPVDPLEELDAREPLKPGEPIPTAPQEPAVDASSVEIPEDWASKPWNEVRKLAIDLGGHPARKEEAVEFISKIVEERASAQS